MCMVFASLGISLDGFIAGPNAGPDNNLGDGGGRIVEWMYRVEAWRERQSLEGGKVSRDAELLEENYGRAGALTFVTEGVEAAVKQASEHAGDGIVGVAGASVVRQCLNAGLLDAVRVSLVPYLLGEGIPYFAGLEATPVKLGQPKVVEGKHVTHLTSKSSASRVSSRAGVSWRGARRALSREGGVSPPKRPVGNRAITTPTQLSADDSRAVSRSLMGNGNHVKRR